MSKESIKYTRVVYSVKNITKRALSIIYRKIRKKVFENYRQIINTNAFTKDHTLNNVNRPPESVMRLIGRMMEDPEMDLGKI